MSLIKVGIIVEIFLFVGVFLWVRKLNRKQSRQPSLSKKNNKKSKLQINLALNYGSKKELVYAFNKLKKKTIISENDISNSLYTKNIPDPEILIRTGNTQRLSNFFIMASSLL